MIDRARHMEGMMTLARTFLMIAIAAGSLASIAPAQSVSDSESLLDAIEDQDDGEVLDLVNRNGRSIINVRGYSGATALTLALRKRAMPYVYYLLQNGADPNYADKSGEIALIIAARMGNLEAVNALLSAKAAIDATNRQGETALIVAVQTQKALVVRRLLEAGASASHTDSASGLSARDYAVRDRRGTEILKLIDSVKKKPVFVAGPVIR